MSPQKAHHKSKIFYGWYIVAAAFIILFINSGTRLSFGVIFKPMIAEFGWNRSLISSAYFLHMTVFAFSLAVVGKFYDRYGPKWVIIVSTVFVSVGYMLISAMASFWQFFISYGVIAAIGFGGTTVTLLAAITSKWFDKHRGLAISLALSGSCWGQFVLVPVFSVIVLSYGWRASYFLIALVMLVVNLSLALLVIKGDPAEFKTKTAAPIHNVPASQDEASQDLSLKEAMGTSSFWVFFLVMFICGSGDFLVAAHLIPFVTDCGISAVTAGKMLAWFGLLSLAGMLIAGYAADFVGNKGPLAFTFLLRIALFLLVLRYQNTASFYIFALAFGSTFLVTAVLSPILIGRMYGLSHVGLISGVVGTIHHIGGGLWAFMGGLIFDQTGDYRLAFAISAIMALVAFFGSVIIKEKRHQAVK
jgi:MFS family permease